MTATAESQGAGGGPRGMQWCASLDYRMTSGGKGGGLSFAISVGQGVGGGGIILPSPIRWRGRWEVLYASRPAVPALRPRKSCN